MAESLSSRSKSSSTVSYSQIYNSWLKKDQGVNVHSTIPVEDILINLTIRQVLNRTDYEMVNHEGIRGKKLLILFIDILPLKGEPGFDQLVKILFENKWDGLANDLLKERDNVSRTDYPNVPNGNMIPSNTSSRNQISEEDGQMKQTQTHLSRLIKENVDFMAKYWSDVIRVAQTETVFVQVQVLEHFKAVNGKLVSPYHEVFDKDEKTVYKRILIQADPGCGKTTYVNKLALDWANEDEYLRDKFDFVFLIALQTLTMDVFDTIKWFMPDESEQFFASYAKSRESKILLILDGFDEIVENSEWYSPVMNILNGQSKQFQFYYVIVTTRRSHVDKIPQQFHERSLLIKGFDKESMKKFLIKQNVPLPSVGQESNFSHLLQTPLFCAIYCSLHFGGGDPIELEDSYDLIKALVENSVTNTVKKKTVANVEEQLNEIGKFAFQMLDSESLNFLKKFCRSSEVVKSSFDLSKVNLDLLIKRTIPLGGVNRFQEEFGLPHQLIAEYLTARYLARSLTKEQLKQADASALNHKFHYRTFDLPFVRFFLFELLFLYLEKKYEESVFDNIINTPGLRFIWNIKSNTDIPTLDNVSYLDFHVCNSELRNHSRFIPTLSKCLQLSSLGLFDCELSKNQVEQLVNFINSNCFRKLIELILGWNENVGLTSQLFPALWKCKHLEVLYLNGCELTIESINELAQCIDNNGLATVKELYLGWNENVGSTPQLFTAWNKCKHLQVLDLNGCKMTVESTTELARCIDNNGLGNLKQLDLSWNKNVGSSTDLFHDLHKCPQLQRLHLDYCSMTQESLKIFLSTLNSNTFQQLHHILIWGNEEIKVDDNFFIALEKCQKISTFHLSKSMESDLSEVGRNAKETLEQQGCQFLFD